MSNISEALTRQWDVIVVGGGVAGLCAATAAHDAGAATLLLEASDKIGGTASWSGGALWIPANHHLLAAGGHDSREQALAYMRACAGGPEDDSVLVKYVDCADEVIKYLESATPLQFEVGTMPDYQGLVVGAFSEARLSRSLAPTIFNVHRLGEAESVLRRSPYGTMPFGYQEFSDMDAVLHPERIDEALFAERLEAGYIGWGEALTGALLLGLKERNVEIVVNARVKSMRRSDEDGSLGCEVEGFSQRISTRALILCCGGYEWDAELVEENFPGVSFEPATVPTNRGDGWRMAVAHGAAIANRGVCWGWPAYKIPGETIVEGTPLIRTCLVERTLPHLILVNAKGERFVDESLPYHTILKALLQRDDGGRFINLPAYHVFDGQFREKYAFGPLAPGMPLPDWVDTAPTPEALARKIGIDRDGLEATLARFNRDVLGDGADHQFHRGEQPYGRFWGDKENLPAPNLGTLEVPPYHAVPVVVSNIGTCGGPRIDCSGKVLDRAARPIPGLYAAGNCTAAISGPAYFGPGGTIGPAMVFGVLAGRAAAGETLHNG